MKILLGFLFGLILGPFVFHKYLVNYIPRDKFVPKKVILVPTPHVLPTVSITEIPEDEITANVFSMEIENNDTEDSENLGTTDLITLTPTPTIRITPTKFPTNPTLTPTPTSTPTPSVTVELNIAPSISLTPTGLSTQRKYSSQKLISLLISSQLSTVWMQTF